MRRTLRTGVALLLCLLMPGLAAADARSAGQASREPATAAGLDGVKNVILFVGDGMGPQHLQLGRGLNGGPLFIDGIPWAGSGLLDTRALGGAVTDSAAGGTALATGVETLNGWVSMVPRDWPWDLVPVAVETVLERAEANGKATGLITDLELSDATPAVFAAHVPDRDLGEEITAQMAAQGIEALFSGGWSESGMLGQPDVLSLRDMGPYLDGTEPWPTKMYGIFGKTPLAYTLDREEEGVIRKQPTLPQLTQAALGILGQNTSSGFFVMIEAGANDWGGHARDAAWIGAEILELDDAVEYAYGWAQGRGDTLIVVTADHETGGLQLGPATKYALIEKQTATTEWMWGLIKAGKLTIRQTLARYAGMSNLTSAEEQLISRNREMGISDVLAARFGVTWGWSGTDEGDHTATQVPVMAWGPGADQFAIPGLPNETVGRLLLDAVTP